MAHAVAIGAELVVTNKCPYTIWPAISNNPSSPAIAGNTTGFVLPPNTSKSITTPIAWSGRLWARTLCTDIEPYHRLSCTTGDCGTGDIQCGTLPLPPVTLIDMNSGNQDKMDSYEVTLVAGFNVPVSVIPPVNSGCQVASCTSDVNSACPPELKMVSEGEVVVGCMSACQALKDEMNCCVGEYKEKDKCKPTKYNNFFKALCPSSMTYFFDNSSTFTCEGGSDYVISFCDH
ncbi:putative Thaumatin family [Dioscorea sansibarensis]